MKNIKWKSLVITSLICLLTIIPGLIFWNDLPESMAIHFDMYNRADNFSSRAFAVFGLPLMMVGLQIFCCVINDINAYKHGRRTKFETVTKWIIPLMTVILQIITLGYNLGWSIDIRKSVAIIIGIMFVVLGNYMPKIDYVKNYNIDTQKSRKINRFMGYGMVIMGILILLTVFLPPIFTIIWLFMLIPFTVISIIYSVIVCRKAD